MSDSNELDIKAVVDISSVESGMSDAASAVQASTAEMSDSFSNMQSVSAGAFSSMANNAATAGDEMEAEFSKTEARHAAHMLGMNRAVGSFVSEMGGVGTAMAAAFYPLAIIELIEWLVKGVEKLSDWANAAESVKGKAVETESAWVTTMSSIQAGIDKTDEKIVSITQGSIAGMEFGLKHMGDMGVIAMDKVIAEMGKFQGQIGAMEGWWGKFIEYVQTSGTAGFDKVVNSLVLSFTGINLKLAPINNTLLPTEDLRKFKNEIDDVRTTAEKASPDDPFAGINKAIPMALLKIQQLKAALPSVPDALKDSAQEEIRDIQKTVDMLGLEQKAITETQKLKQAEIGSAGEKQQAASDAATLKGQQQAATQERALADKTADDMLKDAEAAAKNQVALEVATGTQRVDAELEVNSKLIAAQKAYTDTKENNLLKEFQAMIAINEQERQALVDKGGNADDAKMIENANQRLAIEAKYSQQYQELVANGNRAVQNLETQATNERTEIYRKSWTERIDDNTASLRSELADQQRTITQETEAIKQGAAQQLQVINEKERMGLLSFQDAQNKKKTVLDEEKQQLNTLYLDEYKWLDEQKQQIFDTIIALKQQLTTLSSQDPLYQKLIQDIRTLSQAYDKNGEAQVKMMQDMNKQLTTVDTAINKQSLTWGQYFQKFNVNVHNAAQTLRTSFQNVLTQLNQGFGNAFNQWISGSQSFAKSMAQMGDQILSSFVGMLVNMALEWVEKQIFMTLFKKSQAVLNIQTDAGEAGAAGTASMAGAPWPLNMSAPAFGAAMSASAEAFGSLGIMEQGALVPNDQLAMVHKNEMVLPAHISNPMQNMLAKGNFGGGQDLTVHNNIQIHAMDGASVERVLQSQGDLIGRMSTNRLIKAIKQGQFRGGI